MAGVLFSNAMTKMTRNGGEEGDNACVFDANIASVNIVACVASAPASSHTSPGTHRDHALHLGGHAASARGTLSDCTRGGNGLGC